MTVFSSFGSRSAIHEAAARAVGKELERGMTTSSLARRSPGTGPPSFVMRAGWTSKALSRRHRLAVRERSDAGMAEDERNPNLVASDMRPWYQLDLLRGARGFTYSPRT